MKLETNGYTNSEIIKTSDDEKQEIWMETFLWYQDKKQTSKALRDSLNIIIILGQISS